MYARFGGWSFMGYVKGAYRMADGTQSLDTSESYVVMLDAAQLPELEEILRDFKTRTLQEVIYLEIERDIEVRFI